MRKARILILIIVAAIFSSLLSMQADSPAPPNFFYFYVTNANSNVQYADILIKINKGSSLFTKFNSPNTAMRGFNRSTPIVAYNQDGYMSMSFHCKSSLDVSQTTDELSGDISHDYGYDKPISAITNSIKIALLDENGNILKVSKAVSVTQVGKDTFPREVRYDARGNTPTVVYAQYYHSSGNLQDFFVLLFLLFLIRMVISTTIETLIAIPYKIRPLWKIVAVNIATQVLPFAFTTFSGLSYTTCVILGEVFVYIAEFVAYLFLIKKISKPKLLFYTVVANTASLAIGLILNYFHILVV